MAWVPYKIESRRKVCGNPLPTFAIHVKIVRAGQVPPVLRVHVAQVRAHHQPVVPKMAAVVEQATVANGVGRVQSDSLETNADGMPVHRGRWGLGVRAARQQQARNYQG